MKVANVHGETAHTIPICSRPNCGSDTSITLWWRWPIFLSAGMPSRDTAELYRMVAEKASAAASGMVAAQTETLRIAAKAFTGKKTPHASTAVAAAALKPAFRTVKANAKRLRKKR